MKAQAKQRVELSKFPLSPFKMEYKSNLTIVTMFVFDHVWICTRTMDMTFHRPVSGENMSPCCLGWGQQDTLVFQQHQRTIQDEQGQLDTRCSGCGPGCMSVEHCCYCQKGTQRKGQMWPWPATSHMCSASLLMEYVSM